MSAAVITEDKVLFAKIDCGKGYFIGHIHLNSPASLNSIDLDMVDLIQQQLDGWRYTDEVVAVFIDAAGDRSFAPGGDIRQLYDSMQSTDDHLSYAKGFFHREYHLNYQVHIYPKPVIAWGFGFIMGGGLGLFVGASHRVATQTAMIAWPEITIGLFPDVTASYFLSRMPRPIGQFLGLTGARLHASDAIDMGLADYHVQTENKQALIDGLKQLHWCNNKAINTSSVSKLIDSLQPMRELWPASRLQQDRALIQEVFSGDSAEQIEKNIQSMEGQEADSWFRHACDNFLNGCPSTAKILLKQLKLGKTMSLKEVVKMECVLANQSIRRPDFSEGVRAQIIEKCGNPKWKYKTIEEVPSSWIESFFSAPWDSPEEHPLYDM